MWASMLLQRKPGVSVAAANTDLTNAFLRSYAAQRMESPGLAPAEIARPHALAASVLSERGPNESSFARVATWVAGVAVIVLLIACANVANLLLARALRRRQEIAIRLVVQGALCVVRLIGAGLFVRSLRHVRAVPLGYDVDPVLLVDLNMRGVQLDSAHGVALRRDLLETAQAIPEVMHASRQLTVPFWSTSTMELHVAGIDSVHRLGEFALNAVTPEYFATLGTRILRGRGIAIQDAKNAPRATRVSDAMAKTLWPGRDPIGQCVKVGADTLPCSYVVGVAENIKYQHLGDDPGLFYYVSEAQWHPEQGGLFIRTRGQAAPYAEPIRRRLQQLMPGTSYVTVTPLREILGEQTRSWQLGATMFLAFGSLALALAAIGLYSVMAYNVSQRTQELGVRAALGAQQRDLVKLVVNEGLTLGAAGIVIGVVIALAAGNWLGPLLFQESPHDPLVFGFVTVALLGVTVVASFIPSRRAARVDPMVALRYE